MTDNYWLVIALCEMMIKSPINQSAAGRIGVMSIVERSRNTRSHSLKPLTQPSLLTQRSKRTLSLPNKAIIPPVINIQRCYDQDENFSGDEDRHNHSAISDDMSCMAWYTPVLGLSCSLVMYFWSCALAYYATS